MIYLCFYICLRSYVFLFLNKLAEIFFTIWNFASKKYLFLVIHHKVCDISVNTVWNIACLISFSRTKCALLYHLHSKMPQLLFHKFVSALKKKLAVDFFMIKICKTYFLVTRIRGIRFDVFFNIVFLHWNFILVFYVFYVGKFFLCHICVIPLYIPFIKPLVFRLEIPSKALKNGLGR